MLRACNLPPVRKWAPVEGEDGPGSGMGSTLSRRDASCLVRTRLEAQRVGSTLPHVPSPRARPSARPAPSQSHSPPRILRRQPLSSLAIFSRFSNHIHLPSPDTQSAASSSYVPPWPISAPIRYPTPTGQLPQRSLHRHLSRALIPLEHSSACSGSVRYVLCRGAVPSLHLYMCLFSLSQGFPPACSEC